MADPSAVRSTRRDDADRPLSLQRQQVIVLAPQAEVSELLSPTIVRERTVIRMDVLFQIDLKE